MKQQPSSAETLKEKTARGLMWGGLGNVFQQVVGVVFGIIVGRLLSPSDYGMTAVLLVFTAVAAALQESGFKSALANMDNPRHEDYNAVFWFNIIVGALLYVVLFVCAPFIASYYHDGRLTALSRYVFLSVILSSWGTAQSAYLFKNLMVRQQLTCNMTAILVAAVVTVVMACAGFGYWALATQGLVYVGTNSLLLWTKSPWRPSLHVSFTPIRGMIRFSYKMLATYIISILNINILNILLGHYFTSASVGNYNQAYQWSSKAFSVVQSMVQQVAQPVLAGIRDERERRLRVLRKMMRFTSFLSFPLMLGLALVAEEFIVLALTAKWGGSVPHLRMLCVSGAVMPLCALLYNTLISEGYSNRYFFGTASLGVLQIGLMLWLWPRGIVVLVATYVALNTLWLFVWHALMRRETGYSLAMLLADTVPFAAIAAAVMAVTYLLTSWIVSLWALLAARIVVAAVLYYVVLRLLRVHILEETTAFIADKLKKRR